MMKKLFVLFAIAFSTLSSVAQTQTWKNDPAHSRLGFVVKHLTISEIDGRFNDFSIEVITTKPDYSDAKIMVMAKVASINTDVTARDNHLRSADFFDMEKYPVMTFHSVSLKKTGDNTAKLYGDLTLHGITKAVTLDVVHLGTVKNPMNNAETAGFQIKGIIKRSDYNLGSKFPEAMISDDVQIIANAEFSPVK